MEATLRAVRIIFLVALIVARVDSAAAAPPSLASELALEMSRAGADDLLPVIIVMREQLDTEALLPTADSMPPRERREFAIAELHANAATTQGAVRSFLAAEEAVGRASRLRTLWIANGILVELTPSAIEGLLAFPEIRRILWDPPIPDEEAHDVGEAVPDRPVVDALLRGSEIWQLENINAPDAWALGFEGEGIVIAVEDNGVYRDHGDIASRIWNNDGEIPGNGVDDDANGYVDDTWGWDFQSNDNDPSPAGDDHGTKCAGIAAGDGTEGIRTGVAPEALIMACKVSSWGSNIEGIEYAIDNGAHVITMSRSQKWRFVPKPDYDWWRSITDGELLAGIFHANSIGNEGDNQGTDPIPFNVAAPGCCPTPWPHPDQVQAGVSGITSGCGALDENDVVANYSSRGPFNWEDIIVNWPEYPWSMRPEYQDYPWSGGQPGLLKPDVLAPGPGTTSIAIGGGYGSFGGTSAATPHVAGAMALLLSANPFLTPAQMTQILQTTAVDLGTPGKDNVYGAGKVDCLAAVQQALLLNDFGIVQGLVTDDATLAPIDDVVVEGVGTLFNTKTNASGDYLLGLPEGPQTVRYSNFFYAKEEVLVTITSQQTITVDVEMTLLPTVSLRGSVLDSSTQTSILGATVEILGTPVTPVVSGAQGYSFQVPIGNYAVSAQKFGYAQSVQGVDLQDNTQLDFELDPALVALDMEADPLWQAGVAGDDATTGVWIRVDPNGTAAQPEVDHTPDPGTQCWVTGQGTAGGAIGENDVDNGRTTLQTAVMDLSAASDPVVSYWAWYSNNQGSATDDEWLVEISDDGGTNWSDLLRTGTPTNGWELFVHRVSDFVTPSSQVVIRFIASDEGSGSIVEAAIDDFQLFGTPPATGVELAEGKPGAKLALHPNFPNPFGPETDISFSLSEAAPVELRVFDVAGRMIRRLVPGEVKEPGLHRVRWDATNAEGARVSSGVYFYRVEARGESATRKMILLR